MTVDTVIALEPSVKKRVEVFLNYTGLTLSEFFNGVLIKFLEVNGVEEIPDDYKFEFKNDNNAPSSSFVLTKKELIEKINDALRRYSRV